MTVSDADFAALQALVSSLSTELGSDPSGVYSTLRNRLDIISTNLTSYQASRLINMGGDISGFSNSAIVKKIQGFNLSGVTPQNNYVLTWNQSQTQWEPRASQVFTAAGDLFGTASTQKVIAIQGRAVASTTPTNGQVLAWNSGLSAWSPTNAGSGTFSAGGDLSGSDASQKVVGIDGYPIVGTPATGNVISFNGTSFVFTAPSSGFTAGGDLSGSSTSQTVVALRNIPVSATVPTTNQILLYNGSAWTPAAAPTGFTAGGDLSGSSTSQTVIALRGFSVLATTPTTNQVLTFNGSAWAPASSGSGFTAGTDLSGTSTAQTVIALRNRSLNVAVPTDGYALTWENSSTSWIAKYVARRTHITITSGMVSYTGADYVTPVVVGHIFINKAEYPTTATFGLVFVGKKTDTMNSNVVLYNVTTTTSNSSTVLSSNSFGETITTITPTSGSNFYELRMTPAGTAGAADGFILSEAKLVVTY